MRIFSSKTNISFPKKILTELFWLAKKLLNISHRGSEKCRFPIKRDQQSRTESTIKCINFHLRTDKKKKKTFTFVASLHLNSAHNSYAKCSNYFSRIELTRSLRTATQLLSQPLQYIWLRQAPVNVIIREISQTYWNW